MQRKDNKTIYLRQILGKTIKAIRIKNNLASNKLANEYDIDSGNLSRIENAKFDCKFITIYRIAEALGLKFSDFAKILEENLGEDFKLMDE